MNNNGRGLSIGLQVHKHVVVALSSTTKVFYCKVYCKADQGIQGVSDKCFTHCYNSEMETYKECTESLVIMNEPKWPHALYLDLRYHDKIDSPKYHFNS